MVGGSEDPQQWRQRKAAIRAAVEQKYAVMEQQDGGALVDSTPEPQTTQEESKERATHRLPAALPYVGLEEAIRSRCIEAIGELEMTMQFINSGLIKVAGQRSDAAISILQDVFSGIHPFPDL